MKIKRHTLGQITPVKLKEKKRPTPKTFEFKGQLQIRPLGRGVTLKTKYRREIDFDTWLEHWGLRVNETVPVQITVKRL